VELNRQFAPDVYLGVDAIGPEDGDPVDWAVVMRRLPDERRLSSLIASGVDVTDSVRDLARQLAVHHARAARSSRIDQAGTPDQLRRRWSETLDALRSWTPTPLDPTILTEIAHLAMNYVYGRHALLFARVSAGRIRDGHGDLLADDIFCLDDGPRILDCLEFDDDLRAVDGLDDAACLAMDLERLGAGDLSGRFIDWFCEFSGEARNESLVHHYMAYRAVVRMKVAYLRWSQGEQDSLAQAQRLAEIAVQHLRAGQPRLILVGGTPGTGKSTVAGVLADRLGAVLLRSDRVRKENADIPPEQPTGQPWQCGLNAPRATKDTYDRLIALAGQLLSYGETVVLDASWSTYGERAQARQAAADAFCTIQEIRCCAPPEVVQARLVARQGSGDPSDANPGIARLMEKEFQSWPEASRLSTTGTAEHTARDAVRLSALGEQAVGAV
jgi:aminoglycoside phosphotransferase family enzyme/predicted kinase